MYIYNMYVHKQHMYVCMCIYLVSSETKGKTMGTTFSILSFVTLDSPGWPFDGIPGRTVVSIMFESCSIFDVVLVIRYGQYAEFVVWPTW